MNYSFLKYLTEWFSSIYSDLSPMTYSINWPITVRSAVPFRKLYLPPDDDNQPGTSNPSYSVATCLAQWTARSHAARNAVRYYHNHALDGATLFSKLDSNKLRFNVKNEWLWFVSNLMQILSIFLKLQAVKQSGPVFWPTRYCLRHLQKVDLDLKNWSVCPPFMLLFIEML